MGQSFPVSQLQTHSLDWRAAVLGPRLSEARVSRLVGLTPDIIQRAAKVVALRWSGTVAIIITTVVIIIATVVI